MERQAVSYHKSRNCHLCVVKCDECGAVYIEQYALDHIGTDSSVTKISDLDGCPKKG